MRYRVIALILLAFSALDRRQCRRCRRTPRSPTSKGLFLLTDYPAISVRPGTTATVSLRLQNYAMPPERLQISCRGVPQGWTSTIVGGGQPIEAVLPATNASVSFELRLDIPKDAAMGTTNLTVTAKGANTVTLPVAVTLVKDLPAKLTLTPALPELRGTSRSTFEYQLTIKNESGKRIVASLAATAPPNFEVSFTEQYGSQELNAVPLDANQSKDVKLKVRPPNTIGARPAEDRGARAPPRTPPSPPISASTSPARRRSSSPAAKACSARAPRPGRRPRSRSSSPTPAPRRRKASSCPAPARAAGRSSSIRR